LHAGVLGQPCPHVRVLVGGVVVADHVQPEKITALASLVEAVAPGRTGGTRPPSRKELAAPRSFGWTS